MTAQPHHFGVVVGIDVYPAISPLSHARSDAEKFAEWLGKSDGGGLPSENVKLLTVSDDEVNGKPRADAKPIAKQVWEAMDEVRLAIQAQVDADLDAFERSRLYLFVSGHGIAPDPNDAALLMADGGMDYPDNNVSCAQVVRYFERCQYFKEVVVLADCCRQDPGDETAPGRPPWSRQPLNHGGIRKAWCYATQYGDVALEPGAVVEESIDDDSRHGHFTAALLEVLEGRALVTETGEIDSLALRGYVKSRVSELTNGRQAPELISNERIVFRSGVTRQRRTVTIELPKAFSGEVRLTRGLNDEVASHVADGAVWVVQLEDDLYRVQAVATGPAVSFANGGVFAVDGRDLDVRL